MPLARLHATFDHADWIFEPKMDGFRALAYVENGAARLVSRNGNTFKSFPALTAAPPRCSGCDAVLDYEITISAARCGRMACEGSHDRGKASSSRYDAGTANAAPTG